jgi:hypothetical protein
VSSEFETTIIPSIMMGGSNCLKECRNIVSIKNSKFIIASDPIGESILVSEKIGDSEDDWVDYNS